MFKLFQFKRDTQTKGTALLDHLEQIVSLLDDDGLSEKYFKKAKVHLQAASELLKITPMQAALFAQLLAENGDDSISAYSFSRVLHCNQIQILKYLNEFAELEKKKLIRSCLDVSRRRRNNGKPTYRIPMDVINAVKEGHEYQPKTKENISIDTLFEIVEELFEDRKNGELSYSALVNELRDLINNNGHLVFCKEVLKLVRLTSYFESEHAVTLFRFCDLFVNNNDDCIAIHDFEDIFESKSDLRSLERELNSGDHYLMLEEIIEHACDDGMVDSEHFKLSAKAKEMLLGELSIAERQGKRGKDIIKAGSITAKTLFYNEKDMRQITELSSLLQKDNFSSVKSRLGEGGMRGGFACLFYGPPGTGKTETVYQVARQTGRDIMMVDISQTKSMWYGESEKCIKQVFDRYRGLVKASGLEPILLFNEADAIINKRIEYNGNSNPTIAKTENSIQNIILQEIENLDGILIATTNLTKNLDKAFERRFLYKIEFSKPDPNARAAIWKSIIPALSEHDAVALAAAHDFSGGQIENIARKRTVDRIISGGDPPLERLHSFCYEEKLERESARAIGFRT
jgi:hypothetical protein